MKYQIFNNRDGSSGVRKIADGLVYCIPFNPDNADYQKYLEWLAEGNTPEPADQIE